MSFPTFLNPFTDFGFKKLFGEEASLPLLKSFLNSLLPEHHQIQKLEFKNSEFMGRSVHDRRAIFDLYCEASSGEKFIVELQKEKQNFFKDRSVYYATFPIQEQAQRGNWNFQFTPVYCIGILDFCFQSNGLKKQVHHVIQLKNQENKVFYDKLTFIYLEMPNFTKTESELKTKFDLWLYFFKHLADLQEIPRVFMGKEEFETAFETASLAMLTHKEHLVYEDSLKAYRDLNNVLDTKYETGKKEGKKEGLAEGMEEGLAEGMKFALAQLIATGMSEKDARTLLKMD